MVGATEGLLVRILITGAGGQLGRELVDAFADHDLVAATREELDVADRHAVFDAVLAAKPEAVVHAAAWTDVDGCARAPETAQRRNALAVGRLAEACVTRGIGLVVVSTNEVFDGERSTPYAPDDEPRPINPYGASKLEGERTAAGAYAAAPARLGIARTSWLFGPPGNDFPARILAAAERARDAGEPLRVVGDEHGSPTYTHDLAEAIVELVSDGDVGGIHHLVNGGVTSRAGWARELFRQARVAAAIEEVPAATWPRASSPPLRAVLAPTPLPSGEPMRPWQQALADYMPTLLRQRAAAAR